MRKRPGSDAPTPPLTFCITDDDPVMRLFAAALEPDPSERTRQWLANYFGAACADPAGELRAIAASMALDQGVETLVGHSGAEAELLDLVSSSQVVLCRRAALTKSVIERAPTLRMIQRLGVRADSIDVSAARAAGVTVSCLPRRSMILVAEHGLLLLLALCKRLVEGHAAVTAGVGGGVGIRSGENVYNWPNLQCLDGLYGRSLGIVGFGEAGWLLAERAHALGMDVRYVNGSGRQFDDAERSGIHHVALDELLSVSRFVVLLARVPNATRPLFGAAEFALMRSGSFFVNLSRGSLVDESALLNALHSGRLAGAGLDVHASEPRPPGDPLCTLPNVILTPHVAGGSREVLLEEVRMALANVRSHLDGEPVRFEVDIVE